MFRALFIGYYINSVFSNIENVKPFLTSSLSYSVATSYTFSPWAP